MKKKHTKKKQKGGFVTTILGTALASSVIGLTGKAAMSSPSNNIDANNIDANNIDANNIELGSINLLLDTPIGDLEKRTLRQYLEAMKTGLCPKSLKEQTKQIVEKNSSDFSEEQKEKIAQFEKEKEQYEAEKETEKEELKVLEKEGNNEKIEEKKKKMSFKKKALIASGLVLGAAGASTATTFLASELGNENAKQLLENAKQYTSQSPEELLKTVEGFTKNMNENMSNTVATLKQGSVNATEKLADMKNNAGSFYRNCKNWYGRLKI